MIINYIHWNVDPEIVKIFGMISLRYYGILFIGGLLLAIKLLSKIFPKEGMPLDSLEKLAIYGVIGIFAGARLAHCLLYEPAYYLKYPIEILLPIAHTVTGGYKLIGYQGLASHGGVIGLILALIYYSKKTKQPILLTVDTLGVVGALAGFFIRIANLMNSEIIGLPTTVPWAFVFERVDNLPRHPAQLYEALCYLALFIFMMTIYRKGILKLKYGISFGLTITMVFIFRFFIEFVKERQSDFEATMSLDMGQLLSIPFVIMGITFVVLGIRKQRRDTFQPEKKPIEKSVVKTFGDNKK